MTTVYLESVADLTVGHVGPMQTEYQGDGIPFLRSQNVQPHRLDLSDVLYINEEFHRRLRKSALRPGDVVIVRTGKPGTAAVVPPDLPVANCSDLVIAHPGPLLDSQWLSYFINAAAQHFVSANLVGAVQQHFNVGAAKRMQIPLIPLSDQRAIAEVLGAIDDKIAANQIVIAAADRLRRAQYEAILGDWAQPLSDLAGFVNGRAYTKGATGTGRVVIRIAELNSGLGGSTVYHDIEVPDDNIARPGDLLFAWSGSLTAARWYRPEGIVNQHIFKVIPRKGWPMWVVATAVHRKLDDFKAIAADKATTMGHIQRHHLDQAVSVPSRDQIAKHDQTMVALWDRALAAEVESLDLVTLRDTLLPPLMSGRITVRDAEDRVEESL